MLAASLDYTRFKDVGDKNETGEGDITSFRLGITYTFRDRQSGPSHAAQGRAVIPPR